MAVAQAVRHGRAATRLSQRELAEKARLSKSTIARIECADPRVSLAAVESALGALGLAVDVATPADLPARCGATTDYRDAAGRRLPAHLRAYPLQCERTYTMTRLIRKGVSLWTHDPGWSYSMRYV